MAQEINLTFAIFRFYCQALEPLFLPAYKGSALRGGFGNVFKQVVCIEKNRDCPRCMLRAKCCYSFIFETPHLGKAEKNTNYSPHPFVIEPPLTPQPSYQPHEEFAFNLILIGRAIDYLPYFVYTFDELGRKGLGRSRAKYHLLRVENLNCVDEDNGISLFDGKTRNFTTRYQIKTFSDVAEESKRYEPSQISLRFLTPTRIKYQGRLTKEIDFEILMKNILRRLSWIAEIHCDNKWELDYKALLGKTREKVKVIHSGLQWQDWERYSQRQQTRMKMGGFVNKITFAGELAEFLPFIKLGEYLHIGKGTVYGLGKYRIEPQI